jgi:hypothetical protein
MGLKLRAQSIGRLTKRDLCNGPVQVAESNINVSRRLLDCVELDRSQATKFPLTPSGEGPCEFELIATSLRDKSATGQ